MSAWLQFVDDRLPALWLRTGEHILLTGISTGIAIGLGIPLGIAALRWPRLRGVITGTVGMLQTVPSLAMLAFLLALLDKIGTLPAIIALVLYALLPIVRNTVTGLTNLPESIIEAAEGIGMTRNQRLWLVDLPLAAPVIVAGIRTAAVVGVGIATLSAFIGAGGLGQFINRGLSLSNHQLILLGAVPSALLALLVDGSIGAAQWALRRRGSSQWPAWFDAWRRRLAFSAPLAIFTVGVLAVYAPNPFAEQRAAGHNGAIVRIGAKNFTEQILLGELMAQLLEAKTDLQVRRQFDLGGTMICHRALVSGEIDLYAEYTGTALTTILEQSALADVDQVYERVAREYQKRFHVRWLEPFGFNNTYALTVRKQDAARRGWKAISDLKPFAADMRAGWTSEFSERPDGYPGLKARYHLAFGQVRDLDTALMYEAIAHQEVDVICAFATDGRIAAYDLQPLIDDLAFFPPYYAAPVVRQEMLDQHPEIRTTLNLLAGKLTNPVMQRLNRKVDQDKQAPRDVARHFLETEILRGVPAIGKFPGTLPSGLF